jgi:apolipoprotein N-acyltransferase
LSRYLNLLLAFLSGLLLFAAWPVSPLTFLIFIAWVPLLWVETKVHNRKHFFLLVYLTMFVWNVSTTWWIWNASVPGALAAFIANSFLMCLPWRGFRTVKKYLGNNYGYASLVVFWMCFEYIHLHDWGLSWPWLTLGNCFATHPEWVQWYEYTGTSGGTLWVLLVNIFLFFHLEKNNHRTSEKSYRNIGIAVAFLLLPVVLSKFFKPIRTEAAAKNIVVVQPNIDPYEKISIGSFDAQMSTLIRTSEAQIDDNTALIIWPETALYTENRIDEANLKQNFFLRPLWAFLEKHPSASLFTGIESYRQFQHPTKHSENINGYYYESYNGSVLLDSSGARGFYHKSMLVPGVETLPWFLKFLSSWFEKFGGTTAGYARQEERTVLSEKNGFKIAPAICYESIYGEYMSQYVRNGANLICVITNDGWWKNTPGHKQHMNYARLRAIETRTWVARSANTGISCFIDPNGTVINARPYDTVAAIKLGIVPNQGLTFYVKYGDILSKIATFLSLVLILVILILKIQKRLKKDHGNKV